MSIQTTITLAVVCDQCAANSAAKLTSAEAEASAWHTGFVRSVPTPGGRHHLCSWCARKPRPGDWPGDDPAPLASPERPT